MGGGTRGTHACDACPAVFRTPAQRAKHRHRHHRGAPATAPSALGDLVRRGTP